jgi:L-alanine-DL-glutamate epimerase-like enolase superfamily enzyme
LEFGGVVHLGTEAGIGVQPDEQALERYVVKELL